jgi:hypothetical protein
MTQTVGKTKRIVKIYSPLSVLRCHGPKIFIPAGVSPLAIPKTTG